MQRRFGEFAPSHVQIFPCGYSTKQHFVSVRPVCGIEQFLEGHGSASFCVQGEGLFRSGGNRLHGSRIEAPVPKPGRDFVC